MSIVELVMILVISLAGIAFAAWLFLAGVGDFIRTLLLFVVSLHGVFVALTITRKLEIASSELIISYMLSKRVIATEDIDSYFLDEQGINRRSRKFVTIHLANGQRIQFKAIREGNDALLQALQRFYRF